VLKKVEVDYIIGIFYLLYPGHSNIMGLKKESKLARSASNARIIEITKALETHEDAQARLAVRNLLVTGAIKK